MCLVTPSDSGITLIGIYETQLYGYGEKDGKLCIYTKSIFDIGNWKKFYMIDIVVVKADCCEIGIHVAGGICSVDQIKTIGVIKQQAIWIAAREKEYTRIFSINIVTKKFIRHKMLEELYPEFALLDLNFCSTCVKPIISHCDPVPNFNSFIILPQNYHRNVGIFHIRVSINQSNHCLLWKKNDSFKLVQPPASPNIFVNVDTVEVLSVIRRSEEEDGRILELSFESEDTQMGINMAAVDSNESIWHEVAFCDGLCLTRRNENDGNSILNLFGVFFFYDGVPISFNRLDHCTVDANFPSIDSTQFFISYRFVDKDYIYKTPNKLTFALTQFYAIPSFIAFQTLNGSNIVVIPLRILSLSEAAYLSLARIPQPSQHRSLPVVQITCIDYFLQRIRKIFGLKENISKKEEEAPWMSIEFIKKKTGWPKILPLTNTPKLSTKSE